MGEKVRIAVFISGGGTNLQSIIDGCADSTIPGEVVLVLSNKKNAFGLQRAANAGIKTIVYSRKDFDNGHDADEFLMSILRELHVDIIALAGYLKMVAPRVIEAYRGRIVNIHPGLLPDYGGKGMYGINVHRAVIEAGDKESGVTIHLVDEIYDHGKVLAIQKVSVERGDTPEDLAARVLKVEHSLYPEVIKRLAEQIIKERKK